MFFAADVLDLESHPVVTLMQQAILTESAGTFPNLTTQGDWNMLTHADLEERRARAFTRDMMWLSI